MDVLFMNRVDGDLFRIRRRRHMFSTMQTARRMCVCFMALLAVPTTRATLLEPYMPARPAKRRRRHSSSVASSATAEEYEEQEYQAVMLLAEDLKHMIRTVQEWETQRQQQSEQYEADMEAWLQQRRLLLDLAVQQARLCSMQYKADLAQWNAEVAQQQLLKEMYQRACQAAAQNSQQPPPPPAATQAPLPPRPQLPDFQEISETLLSTLPPRPQRAPPPPFPLGRATPQPDSAEEEEQQQEQQQQEEEEEEEVSGASDTETSGSSAAAEVPCAAASSQESRC